MNETSSNSSIEKITEKAGGVLEKLADIRSLILGVGFVMYLDMWFIDAGVDPYQLSIKDVFRNVESISVGTIGTFVLLYSLLMTSTFPMLRFLYVTILDSIGSSEYTTRELTREGRQLAIWSLGFVSFFLADLAYGYYCMSGYHGIAAFAIKLLTEDGPVALVWRVSMLIFALGCVKMALEREVD